MLRGLDEIEKASREAAANAGGSGNWIKTIRIGDGDVAVVRFFTDGDEIIRAKFHDVPKITPKGEFKFPEYCTKEDLGSCKHDAAGVKAYNTLNLWAYHYYTLHKTQNPKIKAGSDDGIWTQVKQGKTTLYKEDISEFRWFRTKFGFQGRYKELFVKYMDKYGSMTDRDYAWSVKISHQGKQVIVNYDLDPKDESEVDKDLLDQFKELPDLGDVVSGKIKMFGQKTEEKEPDSDDKEVEEIF